MLDNLQKSKGFSPSETLRVYGLLFHGLNWTKAQVKSFVLPFVLRKGVSSMLPSDYQRLAARTECDELAASWRRAKCDVDQMATKLTHAAFGLSTEAGEFTDVLKRWIYYEQVLDETTLEEELGDILWYVALACNALGVPMEDIMKKNIAKLEARYPERYTDYQALEEK